MLTPYSMAVDLAGRSSRFPSVFLTGLPETIENVSYCAEKPGRRPAVPIEARSRNSLTPGRLKNGSSLKRQAAEAR